MSATTPSAAHGAASPFTSNTMLSISDIVTITKRDRKTVSEHVREGRYSNAVQEEGGRKSWSVPVKDLVAVGDLDPSDVVEVAASLESAREAKQVTELRTRVSELEKDLAAQTARAEERQALIDTLRAVVSGLLPALASPMETTEVSQ
jgi:putative protein kinase ArgK-like GTPase of G3E family